MKNCISCNLLKDLNDFYTHKKMLDGYINSCKECVKSRVKERYKDKIKDPAFVLSERKRTLDKFYRLNYKDKYKPTQEDRARINNTYNDRYPEKKIAKRLSQHIEKVIKSNHLHHWSYNLIDAKDVIELSPLDHYLAHRHILYDTELFVYWARDGELLDTKSKHLDYLITLGCNVYYKIRDAV